MDFVMISYGIVGSVKDKPISLEMENCEGTDIGCINCDLLIETYA